MADVLDFIGWYNRRTVERLGIPPDDVRHLYLAYHQGRAGYRSGRWRDRPGVVRFAARVARRAETYAAQLERCRARFRCDGWLEVGPWCVARAYSTGPPGRSRAAGAGTPGPAVTTHGRAQRRRNSSSRYSAQPRFRQRCPAAPPRRPAIMPERAGTRCSA